jgi:hypothetical protein
VTDIVGTVGKITGESRGSAVGQEIDADATGGRSKCMPVRQLARFGRRRRKRTSRSVMQQAEKSIRVRNAGDDLRPRLFVLPCAKAHGGHVFAHGAAGAVKRPVVPHAPSGERRNKTTGEPWSRTTAGR